MNPKTGTIVKWNDSKGFGFIKPQSGTKDIFAHISEYSRAHKKPTEGLKVNYFISTDSKGRKCAVEIRPVSGHKNNGRELRQQRSALILSALLACTLGALYLLQLIPLLLVGVYTMLSVVTFLLYAKDKSAAQSGRWRTAENTLHLLALLGGWPGAALAQAYLRHKSKKMSFRIVYWTTIVGNCIGLYWVTRPEGQMWLSRILQNINLV